MITTPTSYSLLSYISIVLCFKIGNKTNEYGYEVYHKKLITYDPKIQMVYLYVIPFTSEIEVESTEELAENPKLNVDIVK